MRADLHLHTFTPTPPPHSMCHTCYGSNKPDTTNVCCVQQCIQTPKILMRGLNPQKDQQGKLQLTVQDGTIILPNPNVSPDSATSKARAAVLHLLGLANRDALLCWVPDTALGALALSYFNCGCL